MPLSQTGTTLAIDGLDACMNRPNPERHTRQQYQSILRRSRGSSFHCRFLGLVQFKAHCFGPDGDADEDNSASHSDDDGACDNRHNSRVLHLVEECLGEFDLSLIHISEPTRLLSISYAV